MKQCYVLVEFGGAYEEKWEHILTASFSKEKLEEVKKEIEAQHVFADISEEEWNTLVDRALEKYFDSDLPIPELIHIIDSKYPLEMLEKAEEIYDDPLLWEGVVIRKVDFIE